MQENTLYGISVAEGVVALLFGIAAVFWPGLTIVTLLYLFAAFILVSGVINLVRGIFTVGQGAGAWFLRVLLAVLQIGIGVYLLRHPHVTFATLILLIGFGLIFRGVFEIVSAFMDDLTAGARTILIIAGALALLAGIIVLFQPVAGGVAFVWVLGLYALIMGPMIIASALSEHRTHVETSKR
jgi:uncharacterized membrane protein HdeD (DUF308 family)